MADKPDEATCFADSSIYSVSRNPSCIYSGLPKCVPRKQHHTAWQLLAMLRTPPFSTCTLSSSFNDSIVFPRSGLLNLAVKWVLVVFALMITFSFYLLKHCVALSSLVQFLVTIIWEGLPTRTRNSSQNAVASHLQHSNLGVHDRPI